MKHYTVIYISASSGIQTLEPREPQSGVLTIRQPYPDALFLFGYNIKFCGGPSLNSIISKTVKLSHIW